LWEKNEAMGDKKHIEQFLKNFKTKMKIFDILFLDDRGKNTDTLANLEITPRTRKKLLEELLPEDYSDGPLAASLYGGGAEMWVFGKWVRAKEIYIKVTLGFPGNAVICISFHLAEYPMKYPFQQQPRTK
jgi:hypothetical protein